MYYTDHNYKFLRRVQFMFSIIMREQIKLFGTFNCVSGWTRQHHGPDVLSGPAVAHGWFNCLFLHRQNHSKINVD